VNEEDRDAEAVHRGEAGVGIHQKRVRNGLTRTERMAMTRCWGSWEEFKDFSDARMGDDSLADECQRTRIKRSKSALRAIAGEDDAGNMPDRSLEEYSLVAMLLL